MRATSEDEEEDEDENENEKRQSVERIDASNFSPFYDEKSIYIQRRLLLML